MYDAGSCIKSHIPELKLRSLNFSVDEDILATLISFRQAEGQSCCNFRHFDIKRSDVHPLLSSQDCGDLEECIRKRISEENKITLSGIIEARISLGDQQYLEDIEKYNFDDALHSQAREEERKFCSCMSTLYRWELKEQIRQSDLESAILNTIFFCEKLEV